MNIDLRSFSLFTDINECSSDSLHNCDSNAVCHDLEGSFSCSCVNGYSGNGIIGNCSGEVSEV